MSHLTRVDSRDFREFYPDPKARHRAHYSFAHRFLPSYIHNNPFVFFSQLFREDPLTRAVEPTLFIHVRWTMFEETTGRIKVEGDIIHGGMVLRRISELTMSVHEVGNTPVALVHMPRPERPVEAHFVAAALLGSVADRKTWALGLKARVFTLESLDAEMCPGLTDAPDKGLFCEWTKSGEHRQLGPVIRIEPEAVLHAVANALQAPDAPAVVSWIPPRDTAPGTIPTSCLVPPPIRGERKPWWKLW